jgi:hypothetical protein
VPGAIALFIFGIIFPSVAQQTIQAGDPQIPIRFSGAIDGGSASVTGGDAVQKCWMWQP